MPRTKLQHESIGHISPENLHSFASGKNMLISPAEWNNSTHPHVRIQYKASKHHIRHVKNNNSGKKTLLGPQHLDDVLIHKGNGFWDSIKRIASNPITKTIVSTLAPVAIDMGKKALTAGLTKMTGNNQLADTISDAAGNLASKGVSQYTGAPQPAEEQPSGGAIFLRGRTLLQPPQGGSFMPIGSGLKRCKSKGLRLTNNPEGEAMAEALRLYRGLSYEGPQSDFRNAKTPVDWMNTSARMNYVRGHRGKKGKQDKEGKGFFDMFK